MRDVWVSAGLHAEAGCTAGWEVGVRVADARVGVEEGW